MRKFLGFIPTDDQLKLNNYGLFVLRVGMGLCMIYGHGWNKFMKLFGSDPIQFADPIGIGEVPSFVLVALAEFVAAAFVVMGLFTRYACIPLVIAMLVVVVIVNWGADFGDKEMALVYLLGFFSILLMGPGDYSLDNYMSKN
jgi:putative oxidoreductase